MAAGTRQQLNGLRMQFVKASLAGGILALPIHIVRQNGSGRIRQNQLDQHQAFALQHGLEIQSGQSRNRIGRSVDGIDAFDEQTIVEGKHARAQT